MSELRLARGPEGGGFRASLESLMAHAAMMTDYEIKKDFEDCLLPVAGTAEAVASLREYANARKRSAGFSVGKKGANNHDTVMETDYMDSGRTCTAGGCARPVRTHNSQAKFCSDRCKKRESRQKATV